MTKRVPRESSTWDTKGVERLFALDPKAGVSRLAHFAMGSPARLIENLSWLSKQKMTCRVYGPHSVPVLPQTKVGPCDSN